MKKSQLNLSSVTPLVELLIIFGMQKNAGCGKYTAACFYSAALPSNCATSPLHRSATVPVRPIPRYLRTQSASILLQSAKECKGSSGAFRHFRIDMVRKVENATLFCIL
jgi:hypothetical protein